MRTIMLTSKQSYVAMFYFLEAYFDQTKADEIGALLGAVNLAEDVRPMDPALWEAWARAVDKVDMPGNELGHQ